MMKNGTVKPVLSGHSKEDQKLVFKTHYCIMQVKWTREHSAICSTFIKQPFVFKTFVVVFLSDRLIFTVYQWPLK